MRKNIFKQRRIVPILLSIICAFSTSSNAFTPNFAPQKSLPFSISVPSAGLTTLSAAVDTKATLSAETTWRLRFSLNGVPTKNGRKVGELFNVDVQFIEDDGYEPPQGDIIQIMPENDEINNIQYLKVNGGRWQLSEDPDDRKDGLWIWGLFKEPLYPFMLFQIQTGEYLLPGEEKDAINPLTLYAQIKHKRDKKTGQVELEATSLNIREFESMKADPFGAAKVEIYEEVKCGNISFRPLEPTTIGKVLK